jgi:DNA-binding transcriptional LysR family regulator
MNIIQLETFVRIVERGSFIAAARSLFTTQSTVSARIRELEQHLGAALFDRSHHRAHLTPKGQELVPYARQVTQLVSSISHQIGSAEAVSGVIRLGVVGLVANTWLTKLVAILRDRYPRVVLRIYVNLTRVLIDRLRDGDLDLALIAGPITEPRLKSWSLGYDEFVWMASPMLEIPDKMLTPRELQQWPILSLSEESHYYPVIERWFSDNAATYRTAVACNSMNVVAELTMEGLGVSLLPRFCYGEEVRSKKLRVLKTSPGIPPVDFFVVLKNNESHPLILAVTELTTQITEFSLHLKSSVRNRAAVLAGKRPAKR